MSRKLMFALSLLAAGVALGEDSGPAKSAAEAKQDPKTLDGMSILGNQEAPKALVIVPWRSSELGDVLGISPVLDDARSPVDKDVFLRALHYYEIRSETTRHDGAPPRGRAAAAAGSHAAQGTPASRRSKS